jgi:predicted enzyme related to lactoylglutathione lyase
MHCQRTTRREWSRTRRRALRSGGLYVSNRSTLRPDHQCQARPDEPPAILGTPGQQRMPRSRSDLRGAQFWDDGSAAPAGCPYWGMPVQLHHIVIDTHDLPRLARFWAQALGWRILSERALEIVIGPDENAPVGMCFMPVTDAKSVKNRVHLDLTSSAGDRDAEIERLLELGARRADIGQTGAESWTVLVDPEGNEFCVIRPKETLIA